MDGMKKRWMIGWLIGCLLLCICPIGARENVSMEAFLRHALEPVGSTMYVWGGGWNREDTAAGREARSIGVSKRWKAFYLRQDSSYDVEETAYQIHDGLDCSGYVGWVVYNTFETKDNKRGYVTESGNQLALFRKQGWGRIIVASQVKEYLPGDIMANDDHIYIVLGQYGDGSVLLVHASPPGVRICGTPDGQGNVESEAYYGAVELMSTYYADWYNMFPDCSADESFLEEYDQFRFNANTMSDAKKIESMGPEEIIELLFE